MVGINISGTGRTPKVIVDSANGKIELEGESYPEDVTQFYKPLLDEIGAWLESGSVGKVTCAFKLVYFNSSSAKAIMMLLEQLDNAAQQGADVTVQWFYDPEDETMQELGEDFQEDVLHATFTILEIPEP